MKPIDQQQVLRPAPIGALFAVLTLSAFVGARDQRDLSPQAYATAQRFRLRRSYLSLRVQWEATPKVASGVPDASIRAPLARPTETLNWNSHDADHRS